MSTGKQRNEGMALLLALMAIIMIAAAIALVMTSVQAAKKNTDFAVNQVQLEEACKAAVDVGIERVWNQYLAGRGNTTGNLASYMVFVAALVNNNEDLNYNGVRDGTEQDWNGDGLFNVAAPAVLIDETNTRELPSGAQIVGLTVGRTDDVTGTTLTIRCTAQTGQETRSAMQSLRVSGERFAGFQYAVLANNINCILCHAEFLSLDLFRNTDASKYNTFDRVKIASLESLLIRKDEAFSNVAGTVYTRGRVFNKDGSLLTASGIAASVFDSYAHSTLNGKIVQDPSTGTMSKHDLAAASVDAEGMPEQFSNLYLNYPTDRTLMTDGELPTNFPAPFPDDNGDRYVNPEEFEKYVNSANGSINFELPPEEVGGAIKAGVAYGVPAGATYAGAALPSASNEALTALSTDGAYDGNLFLVGTNDDPIVIEDKVAVNGDLVISGPIKGRGQLMVSGNVYVVGDVTYADATGQFGQAEDGTENAFALEAGGSIMMGDYLTIRAKNNYVGGVPGTVETYVWQGKFIRTDVATANATMSNGRTTKVGYFDPGVVDAGAAQGTEGQYSFTTSEIMLFNRMERQKWAPPGHPDYNAQYYIPDYTPRYYRLKPGAPIYQYVVSHVTDSNLMEHSVNYLSPGVEVIPEGDLGTAAVHVLDPANSWLSEAQLRQIWFNDEAARRAIAGRNPFKFDGLLYTNNSIFGVTHGYGRHKSDTYGTMILRGGMVCADLGLLVIDNDDQNNTGLRLYYDKRVDAFLNVEDPTQVQFARLSYRYE